MLHVLLRVLAALFGGVLSIVYFGCFLHNVTAGEVSAALPTNVVTVQQCQVSCVPCLEHYIHVVGSENDDDA